MRRKFLRHCGRLGFFAAALALLVVLAAPAGAQDANLEVLRAKALELLNLDRAREGLPPMTFNPILNQAAQAHAEDMLKRNFYSHETPEGKSVTDRYQAAGGLPWRRAAENIAMCTGCFPPATLDKIAELQKGWMNSPGHRKNILTPDLNSFGYGIVIGKDGRLYAVQNFATLGRGGAPSVRVPRTPPARETEPAVTPTPAPAPTPAPTPARAPTPAPPPPPEKKSLKSLFDKLDKR